MTANFSRSASREASAIAANLVLAPMVASMRMPLMAADTKRATLLGTETMLAVTEKAAAVADGVFAAQLSFFQSALHFWPELMSGRTPSILNGAAAERSLNAALKPAGRRVRANFRRLKAKG